MIPVPVKLRSNVSKIANQNCNMLCYVVRWRYVEKALETHVKEWFSLHREEGHKKEEMSCSHPWLHISSSQLNQGLWGVGPRHYFLNFLRWF